MGGAIRSTGYPIYAPALHLGWRYFQHFGQLFLRNPFVFALVADGFLQGGQFLLAASLAEAEEALSRGFKPFDEFIGEVN